MTQYSEPRYAEGNYTVTSTVYASASASAASSSTVNADRILLFSASAASQSDTNVGAARTVNVFARVTSLQNQTGFCSIRATAIVNGKFEIHAESSNCNDLVHWTVMAERKDIDQLVVEETLNSYDLDGEDE